MTKLKHWYRSLLMFLLSKEKIRGTLRKSFDTASILKKLNGLDISKSHVPDVVNAKILKELAELVAPVL